MPSQDLPINFFFEDTKALELPFSPLKQWIQNTIANERYSLQSLNIIFCSDDFLLQINKQYLQHDYYTDIITFQYNENPIEGELYISVDRVTDNAAQFQTPFQNELFRVIIHGTLHCCGYGDANDTQKALMRQKENAYLENLYADN